VHLVYLFKKTTDYVEMRGPGRLLMVGFADKVFTLVDRSILFFKISLGLLQVSKGRYLTKFSTATETVERG
jgi:hypothetical protein